MFWTTKPPVSSAMVSTPIVVLRWDRSIEDWNIAWVALATAPGAARAPAAGLFNPTSRAAAADADSVSACRPRTSTK